MHKDKFLSLAYVWIGGLLPLLKPEKKDLTGKTVVVTGGNSGVGYGLALQLAEMGASVYIACRSEVRAAKARNSMLESCPDAKIGIEILDTASFESVKAFAANWNHGRIDILAHNAGITLPPHGKEFTEDGYEYLYQVNILSSFLLTGLLDSEGKLAEDLRVLFTSSVAAYESSIPDDFSVAKTQLKRDPQIHGDDRLADRYSHTKLLQVVFARALQVQFERDPGNKRLAFSWEPGLTRTKIFEDVPNARWDLRFWLVSNVMPYVGIDERQGSATGVHLATSDSPDVLGNKGRMFNRMKARWLEVDGYSQEKLERVWTRFAADADISWPWRN
ncbi:unnamed protein product [Zymoseptoria tritici ST99CH_3D1]|uniref:NAD(P)-binding protein n=2 Tax=Zymoseptoria tritici TaxID=1047171 RepID=F9XNB0_ZYMTI|nr:uncharacterized protein MYCGRDRAFT_96726 [Zymoseptoria tritici IPO323]EGP83383.1 hypothetical protein MYCGRDRAFT_96726 [Zymoseptoria tritici IPO323]SMR60554.1 unnamed protein product [Zymoseptoria tritici ST99CH_1E4]SMR63668.1 unnamed protein product [Zymoseptoria tritici ST99CH_3D1]